MLKYLFAATAAFVLAASPQQARSDNSKLTVIVFPGVQNLPIFAAQAKGFYVRRGLDVEIKFTPNSDELRNGLAEGRYQIAHSAVDNAFALKDKANIDIAVVLGGDNSFNHLVVQPEIQSLADVKGKTVAVDAVNTAYAFQLYEMLRQKGLNKGDYEVKADRRDGVASGGDDEGQNNGRGDVESSLFHSRRKGGPERHGHSSRCIGCLSGNKRVRLAVVGWRERRYAGEIS